MQRFYSSLDKLLPVFRRLCLDDSFKNLTYIIINISLIFLMTSLETETLLSFTKEIAADLYENLCHPPY